MGGGGGAFAFARVADTFNCSCSASVSANLLFLMADSVAAIRSTTSMCSGANAKFSPLARTSFSGWVSSVQEIVVSVKFTFQTVTTL